MKCVIKRRTPVLAFVFLATVSTAAVLTVRAPAQTQTPEILSELERRTIELFERASPSVVYIAARKGTTDFFSTDENNTSVQTGTGFIWDADGHVVTNHHVLAGTTAVAVRLANGEIMRATIVGLAPTYDLAVVRLQNPKTLPLPLAIGTSANLKVGQFTYAIGNPYGLEQSLTTGVISSLKRRLPTRAGRELANVIQTDAAINPGNSGGPLLDSSGKLIGVNTAIYSPTGGNTGVGFSIPVDIVTRVVPELIKKGRVPTPAVGIVPAAEAIATRLGVNGIIILRVVANSPAARAGLKGVDTDAGALGDVILKIGDKKVHRIPEFTDELERIGVGGKIQLTLKRDDKEVSIELDIIDGGAARAAAAAAARSTPAAPRPPEATPPSSSDATTSGR